MHISVVFREAQCFSSECNCLTPRSGVPVKPTVAQLVRKTSPFVGSVVKITLLTSCCYCTITSLPQINSATPLHTIFKTILSVILGYTILHYTIVSSSSYHLGWTFLCISYVVHAICLFWSGSVWTPSL